MIKLTTKQENETSPEIQISLDELAREGARRMIAEALKQEADEYVEKLRHLRDEESHAMVVRNGKAEPRKVTLGVGPGERFVQGSLQTAYCYRAR